MSAARIAVIIPAWNEREMLPGAVASSWAAGADEVIVADGGSTDGGDEVAGCARIVRSARGRARQINAACATTGADVVLILHADSRLPPGAADLVRAACGAGAVGGAFHKRFDSRHPLLRRVRWRTRLWWRLGLSFGDQAQFVRRDALAALGGLREDVAAEDMDLGMRLRRLGPCVLLEPEVLTSARRLESAGVLRTWMRWWRIALAQLAAGRRKPISSGSTSGRGSSGRG